MGILILVFVIAGGLIWASSAAAKKKARDDEQARIQRANEQTAAACAYIARANAAQAFPVIDMPAINAQQGEFGLLGETAALYEVKTRRVSMGAGTRVRVAKMPIYLFGSQSTPVESLEAAAGGTLYLTNRRIIFLSDMRSATLLLKDIAGLEATLDGLTIHTAKRQKPYVFAVANPALWSLLVKVFSGRPA